MRKVSCLAIAMAIFLTACSPRGEKTVYMTVDEVAQAILADQPDHEAYTEMSEDDMTAYLAVYGLNSTFLNDMAVYTTSGVDAREVAVLAVNEAVATVESVSEAMETYRQARQGDFVGYAPEEADLVEKGVVAQSEGWVTLLICEDPDAAVTAFEKSAGSAKIWLSDLPHEDFLPCNPPGKYDMTPYDTTAILTAWAMGDDSGLNEKDTMILQAASAVLEECGISDETPAIDAETALHDWIVDHCEYDLSATNWWTPMGKEDNLNPYGVLIGGYGICLGYATTFKLLMDMAGIECIIVTGAAYQNREDHAWNMVKIDGEWYCVDVTWDDPRFSNINHFSEEQLDKRKHEYLNVTSDYMRETDHQWDYENVPEATPQK